MRAPAGSADHPRRSKRTPPAAAAPPPSGGGAAPETAEPDSENRDPRPLYTAGGLAAAAAAAVGLAVLTTLTLVGWVAAPQANLGEDIADVFRAAVQAWLVGHLVGFAVPGGSVSFLPLGLVILPGILLYRAGRWLARSCELPRLRNVWQAALAIAGPYAAIAGTLALIGQTETVQPSMVQALATGFVAAFVAGGLGALRQLLIDKDIARRRLLRLMPPRPRSVLVGTASATGVLLLSGLALFLAGLAAGVGEAGTVTAELGPGRVGGTLLLIIQLLYVPNAVIFGMSYAAGPGFAVGAETVVAPTGVALGPLPAFPMLAALPESGPAPLLSLVALAAPLLAGGIGGWLTLRVSPTLVSEAAPMWGFVCGLCTGVLCGALALLAGGPLGTDRLSVMGPSAWQVGAVVALQVGLAAAIVGWVTNWLRFRGTAAAETEHAPTAEPLLKPARKREERQAPAAVAFESPEEERASPRPLRERLRRPWPFRAKADEEADEEADESADLFGISYEAEGRRATGSEDTAPVVYLSERRRHSGTE